jgi:hypothetical protein
MAELRTTKIKATRALVTMYVATHKSSKNLPVTYGAGLPDFSWYNTYTKVEKKYQMTTKYTQCP